MENNIEQITFNTKDDTVTCVGFIVRETEDFIDISFTKNYGEFTDIQTIDKADILKREVIVQNRQNHPPQSHISTH